MFGLLYYRLCSTFTFLGNTKCFLSVYISYTPFNNTEEFQFLYVLAYGHFQTSKTVSKYMGMRCYPSDVLIYNLHFSEQEIFQCLWSRHSLIGLPCKSLVSAKSTLFCFANNIFPFSFKQDFTSNVLRFVSLSLYVLYILS